MRPAVLFFLIASIGLNIWLGRAVVRLENYRYASQLGSCAEFSLGSLRREKCLGESATRSHWGWHIYYALGGPKIIP